VSAGSVKVRLDGSGIRSTGSDVHWDTPGALQRSDRYDLTVYSGCVRVLLDASAPPSAAPPPAAVTTPAKPSDTDHQTGLSLLLEGIAHRLSSG